MPMKDWLHRFQPVQLYIVLILSICYFILQLILSHITHALTLLIDSYHMLCNIIALSGCILTIKHSRKKLPRETNSIDSNNPTPKEEARFVEIGGVEKSLPGGHQHAFKLRNTFGWTRVDVLTMLIVCIFLASLSFSLLVEALQTLVHIDHQDTMHLPIPILILGGAGLVLNIICYILIGGYTMHQGSFLHITSNGDVILDRVTSSDDLKAGERRLSRTKRDRIQVNLNEIECKGKRQGFAEMFRDICSTLFVIICAIIVYFADDENVAKFVDPIISICSCSLLLFLSYPYMKESCLILLQTIPGSIDIEIFKSTLLTTFKDIVSVHDLHIWQLTASKYVSTAHIIFENPIVYSRIMDEVKIFFHQQGITNVTIQPEFKTTKIPLPSIPSIGVATDTTISSIATSTTMSPTSSSTTATITPPTPPLIGGPGAITTATTTTKIILPVITTNNEECLVQCQDAACVEKHCCRQLTRNNLSEIVLHENNNNNKKLSKLSLSNIFTFNNSNSQQQVQKGSKDHNHHHSMKTQKENIKSKSTNNLCVPQQNVEHQHQQHQYNLEDKLEPKEFLHYHQQKYQQHYHSGNGYLKKFSSDSRIDKEKILDDSKESNLKISIISNNSCNNNSTSNSSNNNNSSNTNCSVIENKQNSNIINNNDKKTETEDVNNCNKTKK